MSLIQTDSQHYSDIADAIRSRNGTQNVYYPSDMAGAIRSIPMIPYATLLWSGSLSRDGEISISGLSDWLLILVVNDIGVPIIGNSFCGSGSMGRYNSTYIDTYSYRFDNGTSGKIIIDSNNRGIIRNQSYTTYSGGEYCTISRIYGLVKKPVS